MLKTFQAFKQYAGNPCNAHTLSDEEIQETQKILLGIMDDFDALCKKHRLSYFLTGGSALGAVRGNGFIPWDDDMDVIMPRKDYDRLPEIVERECGDRYWVQNLKTSEKYDLCFSKLRKKGTRFVELFDTEPEKAGFFLDIFPLEDTYGNVVIRFLNGIADEALFFIASCVRVHQKKELLTSFFRDSRIGRSVRFKAMLGSLFDSKKDGRKWYKRCEKWQSKCVNPGSRYATVSCGRGHYFGEMYTREKLFPVAEHAFEGRKYSVPGDCDHLLNRLYGSGYLEPADENKREKHIITEWDP